MADQPSASQPSSSQTIQAGSLFFGPDGEVVCRCGKPATRLVSNTPKNPGRVFWKCPSVQDCKFFKWDDQLPTRPNSQTPTPSQPNPSLPPSTPSARRTSPHVAATPSSSQSTVRLSTTPSPTKRPAPPEPSSQTDRAKRKGNILAALKSYSSSQTLPPTPSTSSPSKFKPFVEPSSPAALSQPPPLPAPDFGVSMSSRASDAGSSYTVHGDLSADDFFAGESSQMPACPIGGDVDILTPPDTGKTQRIPLPEVDNSPLKGKGKAVAAAGESDDEWNMLDDTMDLDATQSTLPSSQAAGPSTSLTISAPSNIDFEHLFDNLGRLPDYIRSLQAENARLKEELEREKTKRINAQRALSDALEDKAR
ncbi:hypothetical protein PENSPDRAFT_757784 [Peniophora sp. CONT]|nr:hypothetical protein PENSPDRAFT_757784 [Peniophora sp. CONT]